MIRTSLVALLSLCLAAALVAKEPDSQPQSELETIAVNVMTKAFNIGDYDTVEALFGKLSPENQKKFLETAVAMDETFVEADFTLRMQSASTPGTIDVLESLFEAYAKQKSKQTQLLGRLTLSLFEPAVEEKPTALVVHGREYQFPQEVVIKSFQITHGDANALVTTLKSLVPTDEQQSIPLRFAVDARTNSIIAAGSAGDLMVVDTLLESLDCESSLSCQTAVYVLKNTSAVELAPIINDYITSRLQIQMTALGSVSIVRQLDDFVVIPDVESNSLIISATPQHFHEIVKLVEEIDRSPHESAPPVAPPVAAAPPGMPPFALGHRDDDYITLNSYGRVYIKGLDASEIINAVTFHLSRYIEEGPRVAEKQPTWSSEMRTMVALDEPMSDEAKLMIDKWDQPEPLWIGDVPMTMMR